MKRHFKKLILSPNTIIIYLLVFIGNVNFAQELSLKEAHNLMLQKNGDLKASHYENLAVEAEEEATKGLRYPMLNITGTYATLDKDIGLELNPIRDAVGGLIGLPDPSAALGDWNVTLQDKNFGFANANIIWPIFTGGKINAATNAAKIKTKISENEHHLVEDNYTLTLIEYYYKLKLALEAETLRSNVYKTIQIHNEHAQKLFENGMIPEVETLNAKVALSNALRELKAAKKDVSLATTAIQNLIGDTNFNTVSTAFIKPVILKPLVDYQNEMASANKQLLKIEQNYELAKIGVSASKSEYFPTVALYGSHFIWKENLDWLSTDWFAGVGLKWDLFNGFKRENEIKAAKLKVNQVKEIQKQTKLSIKTYTEKLYSETKKQQEQFESLESDEALAKKLKFMRTRAFEEGTGTSLEVIDATLNLATIELYKLNALYHYNIAYSKLMVNLGKTEIFLNQI